MTNAELATKLARAAVLLRDLGGEEEYDLADACDDVAQIIRASSLDREQIIRVPSGEISIDAALGDLGRIRAYLCDGSDHATYPQEQVDGMISDLDQTVEMLRVLAPAGRVTVEESTTEAIEMMTDPSDRDDGPYVPSLEAKVEQMIGDLAPDDEPPIGMVNDPLGTQDWPVAADPDEDVVPPELRDLLGPQDDEEKRRRRIALISENVRLREKAQERGRPLSDDAWEALSEAELCLYRDGLGLNGWTDVMENDGSETLNAIWDQAKTYVEMDPDQYAARLYAENLREIAERTAAALSILAFGIGATDLSRLGGAIDH